MVHSLINIGNNTTVTKTYVWERTLNELPEGWSSAVCDANQCYLSHVETQEFDLGPGDIGTMDIHAYPGGNPGVLPGTAGTAEIHIRIWEKDNEENFEVGVYTYCVSDAPNSPINCAETTSTANLEEEQIKVFPNPTNNYIQLDENSLVQYLEVYNLIGERVANFRHINGVQHDISNLNNGMYLLQLQGGNGTLLKTVKLIKN